MRVVVPVDMNGVALLVIQDDALAKFGALESWQCTHFLRFWIEVWRFRASLRWRDAKRIL